jgi:hypothetical protein
MIGVHQLREPNLMGICRGKVVAKNGLQSCKTLPIVPKAKPHTQSARGLFSSSLFIGVWEISDVNCSGISDPTGS